MNNHRKPWSPTEDQYLKDHYHLEDPHEIAAHLGRTVQGVRTRAYTLGLQGKAAGPAKTPRGGRRHPWRVYPDP